MSGDLKDPGASIPKGTILAAITTFILYASLSQRISPIFLTFTVFLCGATFVNEELISNYFIYIV
jgi:hypothetical protein